MLPRSTPPATPPMPSISPDEVDNILQYQKWRKSTVKARKAQEKADRAEDEQNK